ncbi:MAG: MFS transporter [Anaerolineales bacterium]|nr:MFS transporter [Anaerolineales bacterium]
MSALEASIRKNLGYNILIGLSDASFFGIGAGFASFGTILPLFISGMTDSAILIGLIPAIHSVGWQLPQLLTANRVSRLRQYKPMVMLMTIHERLPFLGLALAAWLLPVLGTGIVLPLTFLLLIWQGLGAGVTANAWQSMIAKIIPSEYRGTVFGAQAAVANVTISIAAIAAGYLLGWFKTPYNFITLFLLASLAYGLSMAALGFTREPVDEDKQIPAETRSPFAGMGAILKRDPNFAWFLALRILFQFASMGFAFYIVYGLRRFGMDGVTAGFLTASLTISQTVANLVMGWLADRWGHRTMLIFGMLMVSFSSILAWAAPNLNWFYPIFILTGLANVAYWTIGMAMTVEFGTEAERPTYIGMSNTLVAPATILAPLIGGWIADSAGYQTTFMVSVVGGLVATAMLIFLIKDPKKVK